MLVNKIIIFILHLWVEWSVSRGIWSNNTCANMLCPSSINSSSCPEFNLFSMTRGSSSDSSIFSRKVYVRSYSHLKRDSFGRLTRSSLRIFLTCFKYTSRALGITGNPVTPVEIFGGKRGSGVWAFLILCCWGSR